jgi:hypothetical protein
MLVPKVEGVGVIGPTPMLYRSETHSTLVLGQGNIKQTFEMMLKNFPECGSNRTPVLVGGGSKGRTMSQAALPHAPTPSAARASCRSTSDTDAARGGLETDLYDWSKEVPEWINDVPPPEVRRSPASPARKRAVRPVPAGPPRLTRRGRIVLFCLLGTAAAAGCALFAVAFLALSASNADASTDTLLHLPERSRTVVVNEGDTLWEIAERLRPAEDPRKTVDEIVEINGLTEPVLTPGQELVLPSP